MIRAAAVFAHPAVSRIFAAVHIRDEVVEWLPRLARKRKLDLGLLLAVFQRLRNKWMGADSYGRCDLSGANMEVLNTRGLDLLPRCG